MKRLLTILSLFVSLVAGAQRTYDTAWATGDVHSPQMVGTVTEPAWYARNVTSDSGQAILYIGGLGEVGIDTTKIATYGPHNRMRTTGWNGAVPLGAINHYPLIISLQLPAEFYIPALTWTVIENILTHYRIRNLQIIGISMGGWEAAQLISYRPTSTDSSALKRVNSVVSICGVKPDDPSGASAAYPDKFIPCARAGIKMACFEQSNDFRDMLTITNTFNATVPNSSNYLQTSYGSGEHGEWQHEMGGNGITTPETYSFNGGALQDVYQYMLRHGDTVNDIHTGTPTPPTCSAGSPGQVLMPTSTTTLTGTAAGTNGATIASTTWSLLVKPTGATPTITSQNSLTTTVTGLSKAGNYVFQLTAIDNNGLSADTSVRVFAVPACNMSAPVTYTITPNSGGVSLDLDASGQPWKGGDTVRFTPGWWPFITLYNFSGDPCHPVFVDMRGVRTRVFSIGTHTQYATFYGLEVDTGNTSSAISGSLFNHIRFSHIYIDSTAPGSVGFFLKTTPDISKPETIYPNYEMTGLEVDSTLIFKPGDEGMYIGSTSPYAQDAGQPPYIPIRLDSVSLHDIRVVSPGWDGIQLSAARDNARIYRDTVTNYGTANIGGQHAGIILGGDSRGDIHHNVILKGTGNAIQAFNYGRSLIHDNIIDSAGIDGTTNGEEAILMQDILSTIESNPAQSDTLYNNIITHARPGIASIHSYNDNGTAIAINAHDNTICIPTGTNAGGLAFYIIGTPTPVTANNTLTTTCSTVTANAGSDQVITLPTTSATLNGTSSIGATTYLWTKISGPGATTITGNTTATPTATGLQQGVYVFQLSINSGASTDTVQVTVNAASTIKGYLSFPIRVKLKTP